MAAEGPKMSIVTWPAKLRSAARATRGPHFCCGSRAACCGPRAALKNVKNVYMHPPPPLYGAVGSKGFIEGGGQPREGKNFDLHPPPPVVSSARKGKKAERSSDEDAMLVAARQGF